jgi:hypothetical protein
MRLLMPQERLIGSKGFVEQESKDVLKTGVGPSPCNFSKKPIICDFTWPDDLLVMQI